MRKPVLGVSGFLAVQLQKMATGLKFQIKIGEGLYYPCSENKGPDQLRSYCKSLFFANLQQSYGP